MKLKKNFISCFLLFTILCQFFIPTFVKADIGYTQNQEGLFPTDFTEIDGLIRNYKNQPIDYKEAIVSKKASRGEKDGEFYIDLKIQGKNLENSKTKDIVIILDNSNSMKENDRVTIAKNALTNFAKNVVESSKGKDGQYKIRLALVTYASTVFNELSVTNFTSNYTQITNIIPNNTPIDRHKANDGATFTQAALRKADEILKTSNADEKIIVHLTDGVPTLSYKMTSIDTNGAHFSNQIKGNGRSYLLSRFFPELHKSYYVYDPNLGQNIDVKNHGIPTRYEATGIINKYSTYTIGIELTDNNDNVNIAPKGITKREDIIELMKNISSSPNHYYDSRNINQLSDILAKIEKELLKTVVNGSLSDPMGDMVNLNLNANLDSGKFYKLTASNPSLLDDVNINYDNNTKKISMTGLNLGKDEWVNLRYKVNLRTEDPQYKGNFFYPTNGPTTLTPNEKNPNTKRDFPVPSVKGNTIDVNVQKLWKYKNGTELPDSMKKEIKVKLVRKSTNPNVAAADREKEIAEKTLNKAGNWTGTFEKLIPFDNLGYHFEYTVKEVALEGFESKIEYSNNKNFIKSESADVKITNTKNIEVEFFKYKTENGQKIALPDVEFELYKQDITERYLPVQKNGKNVVVKSGADGKFKFDNLEVGKYAIKEIKAPKGYRTPKNFVRTFEITSEGKVKYENTVYNSDDTFYNIENIKYPQMYFMFRKLDTNGELIKQGILELQLKGPKDKTLSFDLTKSTNDGFKFEIPEDFPTGDYVLTEKTAPMGYQKSNVEYHIRIDAENRTITLVKEVKGSVETQKNIVLYQDNDGAIDTIKHDIKNDKTVYPHTGGTGVVPFVLSGLFVMLCAGSVYILKKKRAM